MKTIAVRKNNADLELTLDELMVIRNSINEVLSRIEVELQTRTGFYPKEIRSILDCIEQAIKELE